MKVRPPPTQTRSQLVQVYLSSSADFSLCSQIPQPSSPPLSNYVYDVLTLRVSCVYSDPTRNQDQGDGQPDATPLPLVLGRRILFQIPLLLAPSAVRVRRARSPGCRRSYGAVWAGIVLVPVREGRIGPLGARVLAIRTLPSFAEIGSTSGNIPCQV